MVKNASAVKTEHNYYSQNTLSALIGGSSYNLHNEIELNCQIKQ